MSCDRRFEQRSCLGQVVDEDHRVRVAHVDVPGRPAPVADPDHGLSEHLRVAEVGGDAVALDGEQLDAVARRDRDGSARVGQPLVDEVPGEEPDAVAAHLAEGPVGVAVVHVPLRVRGLARVHHRGADHPQHPVATDSGTPVTEGGHARRGQVAVHRPVVVGQQHEVVLGAVALEEGVAGGHHPKVRRQGVGVTTAADPPPRRVGSATAVSRPSGPNSIAVAAPISGVLAKRWP